MKASFSWPVVISSALLLSLSILVIYSSSHELALQQAVFAMLGFIIFFILSSIDYRYLKNFIYSAYFVTLILLVFVFILGIETRGSVRWISLGFINIQPSELIKPVIIYLLALFWSNHIPSWRNILLSLFWILPALLLIFRQPDLGTTLTILAIWSGILFAARISFKKITGLLITFLLN